MAGFTSREGVSQKGQRDSRKDGPHAALATRLSDLIVSGGEKSRSRLVAESVLLAGDLVLLGDILTSIPHVVVVENVPQAIVYHRVDHLLIVQPGSGAV